MVSVALPFPLSPILTPEFQQLKDMEPGKEMFTEILRHIFGTGCPENALWKILSLFGFFILFKLCCCSVAPVLSDSL